MSIKVADTQDKTHHRNLTIRCTYNTYRKILRMMRQNKCNIYWQLVFCCAVLLRTTETVHKHTLDDRVLRYIQYTDWQHDNGIVCGFSDAPSDVLSIDIDLYTAPSRFVRAASSNQAAVAVYRWVIRGSVGSTHRSLQAGHCPILAGRSHRSVPLTNVGGRSVRCFGGIIAVLTFRNNFALFHCSNAVSLLLMTMFKTQENSLPLRTIFQIDTHKTCHFKTRNDGNKR